MADLNITKPMDLLLAHSALKCAQAMSLLAPPLHLVTLLVRRRPFSVARLLRTSWMATGAASAASVPLAYYRLKDEPDYAMEDRVFRLVRSPTTGGYRQTLTGRICRLETSQKNNASIDVQTLTRLPHR
jgi:hypothetical protein